ncbi:hypothetical protein ACIPW5_15665 [Streptomyces sp. NPDC090077]|uniref:hypothetical protein n=1 Tax=Streptomyces sp. NPDC090077 TaxID=3365938 RepID=UPI0038243806
MEVMVAVLALTVFSCTKKLLKSAADRNRAHGEAVLIRARAEAVMMEAAGRAEIIRARTAGAARSKGTVR